jgi:hypothetical protein
LRQIKEDIGSAEEQPISNRFDTHTKNEGSSICPFLYILTPKPPLKTLQKKEELNPLEMLTKNFSINA